MLFIILPLLVEDVTFEWSDYRIKFSTCPEILYDSIAKVREELLKTADLLNFDSKYTLGEILKYNPQALSAFSSAIESPKVLLTISSSIGRVKNVYGVDMGEIVFDLLLPSSCGEKLRRFIDADTFEREVEERFPYTGLLIDARGIDFIPSFYPQIVSETGKIIYSVEYALPFYVKKNGLVKYSYEAFTSSLISTVGLNPIRIIPVGVKYGDPTTIVISEEDALKILASPSLFKWIKECKVGIIISKTFR